MGKCSDVPSQTPQVIPKSSIYTPKRGDEHPRHFYMVVPLGLKGATLSFIVISPLSDVLGVCDAIRRLKFRLHFAT